ncbi:amidase [Nocardia sp. SYP-A9097]|uniref:amidase n=1 Tax=Nocardia sp. SYP-A9097 TaxID=2663237 RepID=UPI00129A6245|nr:amidase [Nocardia sp. SYP-A9097]MRH87633.1 amidase [Nocardia sp. SYP-A9097]
MTSSDSADDLVYLDATDALRLFAARALSPVELMRAVIERTEKVEPAINAFTERLFDEAMTQAEQAERRYLGKDGGAPRPLEGLPIAAKEKHAMAGRSLTEGSLVNEGVVAEENAPVIDRIINAGGIIHARTTTPEFSVAPFTRSRMWGITRNPWNPYFSTAGSSGGSGAALASGTATLATGSDIGGSTRLPAALNGVVGFKAPYGRVPGAGVMPNDHYRGDGPMARSVADTVLLQNVLAGPDPRDHTSIAPKYVLPNDFDDVAGMRIALCIDLGEYRVHPEMVANTRATAQALAEAGAIVTEIELPWTHLDILTAQSGHFGTLLGPLVAELTDGKRALVSDYTAAFLDLTAQAREHISYLDSLRAEKRLQLQLAAAMTGFDALLCPTTAVPGWPADDQSPGDRLIVHGEDVGESFWAAMTMPFNITNRCPVLNVPSGHSEWGIPTGVQVVGHPYDDATVFRIGKALEQLRPWAYRPGNRPAL